MADGATVLVVGADDAVVAFLVALLQRDGIDARPAAASDAAVRVNEDEPALVLVDHDLEAVRSIRALADPKRASVPIVVLRAEGASSEGGAAFETGGEHTEPYRDDAVVPLAMDRGELGSRHAGGEAARVVQELPGFVDRTGDGERVAQLHLNSSAGDPRACRCRAGCLRREPAGPDPVALA